MRKMVVELGRYQQRHYNLSFFILIHFFIAKNGKNLLPGWKNCLFSFQKNP